MFGNQFLINEIKNSWVPIFMKIEAFLGENRAASYDEI